ncbi:MAG: hypothetical protein ACTSXU_17360, partial [Promethearchaeota archaeon]
MSIFNTFFSLLRVKANDKLPSNKIVELLKLELTIIKKSSNRIQDIKLEIENEEILITFQTSDLTAYKTLVNSI